MKRESNHSPRQDRGKKTLRHSALCSLSILTILSLACTMLSGCSSKTAEDSEDLSSYAIEESSESSAAAEESSDSSEQSQEAAEETTNTAAAVDYTTTATFDSDAAESGSTYTSTGTDENAILVTGGTVELDNVTVTRNSSDSTGGDNSSFYGVGAAVLTTGGTLTISGGTVDTDSQGGAGVFAYGDGVIYVSDVTINTEKNTSGGIHVAGGGTLYATDVTATTQGESSAAVRSDRGGGLMVVNGGSYTSNGTGSPAVYCTANIVIQDAELTANGSEAVCIEGLNSLYLYDCDLTGNMPENEQNDCTWNIILYQSMSGDSQEGNSTFQMVGGTLTAENGGMFYTTNTESTFILKDVTIVYADDNDYFLKVTGNSNARGWGSTGSNGADCTFTAIDQDMTGDVIWDSISNLTMYMTDGSTLTGAFLDDESNAGDGGNGTAALYIDSTSTWTVTEDSTLTSLYNAGTIVDENGKTVTIVGTDGTVYVQGTGDITVTVETYSTDVDLSGASTITEYEDAQVNTGYQTTGMGGDTNGGDMGMGGNAPDGNGQMGDGTTPPDLPDGSAPTGSNGSDGSMPSGSFGSDGNTPPSMPGGDNSNMGNMTPPDNNGMGGQSGFDPNNQNGFDPNSQNSGNENSESSGFYAVGDGK